MTHLRVETSKVKLVSISGGAYVTLKDTIERGVYMEIPVDTTYKNKFRIHCNSREILEELHDVIDLYLKEHKNDY